jgi:predicted nucleic acid-binding Zn ribbon protein
MLSVEKCNEILNKNNKQYNVEQVKAIREYLITLAEIIYELKMKKE